MNHNFIKTLLCTIFILYIYPVIASDTAYYEYLGKGQYRAAAGEAYKNINTSSSVITAINLLRIYESAVYCEDITYVISLIEKIPASIFNDEDIYNLKQSLIMKLNCRIGNRSIVEKIKKDLNFEKAVSLKGPFRLSESNGIESLSELIEDELNKEKNNSNRGNSVPLISSIDGIFTIDTLIEDKSNKGWIAQYEFNTDIEGFRSFTIGSSGKMIVTFDDTIIFKDEYSNEYFSEQRKLQIFATAGSHVIKVYIRENTYDKIRFSIRNNIIKTESGTQSKSTVKYPGYIEKASGFDKAYLQYMSGFISSEGLSAKIFESLHETDKSGFGLYYEAKMSENSSLAEIILQNKASESVYSLILKEQARIYITYGKSDAALEYINKYSAICSESPDTDILKIQLFISMKWYEEAYTNCTNLSNKGYVFTAQKFKVFCLKGMGIQSQAFSKLIDIYKKDYDRIIVSEQIYDAVKSGVRHTQAVNILEKIQSQYPENIKYGLLLSEIYLDQKMYEQSFVLLMSLHYKAPFRPEICELLSQYYFAAGKIEMSQFYKKSAISMIENINGRKQDNFLLYQETQNIIHNNEIDTLSVQADTYSDESVICLLTENNIRIQYDGTVYRTAREIYKINKAKELKIFNTKSIVIKEQDQLLYINYWNSKDSSGKNNGIVKKEFLSDPEKGLYYDLVRLSIDAPSFSDNDIIVFEYGYISDNMQQSGHVGTKIFLDCDARILKGVVSIESTVKLKAKVKNWQPNEENSNGEIIQTKKYVFNNIPSQSEEAFMLPYNDRVPFVWISSFFSLKDFIRWYLRELGGVQLSQNIKSDIDLLIKNAANDRQKVEIVYKYITARIRYAGFEIGLGGFIPKKPDETYYNAYGDCKDIALLLREVFRYIGIKADIALMRTRDSGMLDKNFIAIDSFNHALCRIEIDDEFFLDGTVKGKRIVDLPNYNRNTDALILSEDKARFVKIEGNKYFLNKESVKTEIVVHKDLSAQITRTRKREGYPFVCITPEDLSDVSIKKFWESKFSECEINKFIKKRDQINNTILSEYEVNISDFAFQSGTHIMVPIAINDSDILNSFFHEDKRKEPFLITDDMLLSSSVTIDMNGYIKINNFPDNVILSNDHFDGSILYAIENNKIVINRIIRIKQSIINPSQYKIIRKQVKEFMSLENKFVLCDKGE